MGWIKDHESTPGFGKIFHLSYTCTVNDSWCDFGEEVTLVKTMQEWIAGNPSAWDLLNDPAFDGWKLPGELKSVGTSQQRWATIDTPLKLIREVYEHICAPASAAHARTHLKSIHTKNSDLVEMHDLDKYMTEAFGSDDFSTFTCDVDDLAENCPRSTKKQEQPRWVDTEVVERGTRIANPEEVPGYTPPV